ncbi:LysR family transcriptional regulator [Bordetella genomosp. 10]|uniref:LysR family transcriptional regulator n=1 Tax=Bordetella genomosp. 10 TaxID=1416804 RepID=A0A261SNP0_9BORD|nr:LysR family transcriptional regulator [Bordetella genomosp. 10]OZI38430.1 LysR family transcriptional regulator [Bordetella genomosp. 10]
MKIEMNMRHIEAFRAVMISGSVVGAARLLNVTQPGVSRTIALLELRLGYALFQRKGRRLVPTAEAEALYREVEHLYVGIDRITQVAYDIGHHRAGALRVATLPALSAWFIPKVIATFLQTRPKVRVFVQTLPSTQIAELVATRQFDIGVVELPMSRSGVSVRPLPACRIVAVLPARHRLAGHDRITLRDLAGERLVLPSPQSYLRYQIDDAFNRQGIVPDVVAETPTSPLVCALAAEGTGIGLVSAWTLAPQGDARIVQRSLEERLQSQYACMRPENAAPMALADEFQALIEAGMRAMAPKEA